MSRTLRLDIRLTPEELSAYRAAAHELGISVSNLVRLTMRRTLQRKATIMPDAPPAPVATPDAGGEQ